MSTPRHTIERLRAVRSALARRLGTMASRSRALERLYLLVARPVSIVPYMTGLIVEANYRLSACLRAVGQSYRVVTVAGVPLYVDVSDATGFGPYFSRQPYEPELAAYIARRLREGDVFIDIGANVGLFSMLAARCVGPSGRVVAFEPNPEARSILAALATMNRVAETIDIVPLAVSDSSSKGHILYIADASSLSTLDPARSPVRDVDAFQKSVVVDLTTLDDWLAIHPELSARVTTIKIDVEGVEDRVLSGMQRILRANPRIEIVVETTAGSGTDRRLQADGYTVAALDEYATGYGNFVYRHGQTG